MGRPPGSSGRPQLKADDIVRIQTLSRDAKMGPTEISRVTGYSIYQIKYALKKKSATVGRRTGRPPKTSLQQQQHLPGAGGPALAPKQEPAAAAGGQGHGRGHGHGAAAAAAAAQEGLVGGGAGSRYDHE